MKKSDLKNTGSPKSNDTTRKVATVGLGAMLAGFFMWFNDGGEWFKSLLIAVGLALLIRWPIAEPYRIPSSSMEPTLHGDEGFMKGDRVFVNKWIYGTRYPLNWFRIPFTLERIHYADTRLRTGQAPQRWDIVVFKAVEDHKIADTLVKRVVGLPGERIHIANGQIHVIKKGETQWTTLELPSFMPPVHYTSPHNYYSDMKYGILEDDAHSLIPEGHYLVLGDNSEVSRDGRVFGWLPTEHIIGRVACIWFPFNRCRDFTGFSQTLWWRSIVALIGAALILRIFFGRFWRVRIKQPSRFEHYYVNRWAFGLPIPFTSLRLLSWGKPRLGQAVLYYAPKTHKELGGMLCMGRIAGLPGDRVYLDNGKLTINDAPVEVPVLANAVFERTDANELYGYSKSKEYSQVPENSYFILKDTNDDETPADSASLGWIPRQNLVGAVSCVWWPLNRIRKM